MPFKGAFDTDFIGGGGVSGLTEDQILFGAADGSIDQDPDLAWDGSRLTVSANLAGESRDRHAVIIGKNAGYQGNAYGSVIIGGYALEFNPASNTVAIGASVARSSAINESVLIGHHVLWGASGTLNRNTIIGYAAADGLPNSNFADNTIIGHEAGRDLTGAADNVLIGGGVATNSTESLAEDWQRNVIVGQDAAFGRIGQDNQVSDSIIMGRRANAAPPFFDGILTRQSIILGNSAVSGVNTGSSNSLKSVVIGHEALHNTDISSGSAAYRSVVLGYSAGRESGGTYFSTIIGYGAARANGFTQGYSASVYSVIIGSKAASVYVESIDRSVIIGNGAVEGKDGNPITVEDSVFIGDSAGRIRNSTNSSRGSIAIGKYAGSGAAGYFNISLGYRALGSYTHTVTGSNNIAIGKQAIDYYSGFIQNWTGSNNIAIGYGPGRKLTGAASNNILIGEGTGYDVRDGSYNIFIGKIQNSGDVSAELWIDAYNTTTPLIRGNFDPADKTLIVNGALAFTGAFLSDNITTSAAGNFTVLTTHHIILKTGITGGGDTVTLPSGAIAGQQFRIKDVSGNAGTDNITVDTAGSENIDGSATDTLNSDYESADYVFDGTDYWRI